MKTSDLITDQRRMLSSAEASLLEELLPQVALRYGTGIELPPFRISGVMEFGKILAFEEQELRQLESLRDLILRYVCQQTSPRPLCLAVFGPPGSGKSFAVKQIRIEVNKILNNKNLEKRKSDKSIAGVELLPELETINLTQVSHPNELGQVLTRVANGAKANIVPIVLFDEFDATRDNAPYGWLGWFLAPMHDGMFVHTGMILTLKRAVYVFAGGTCSSMAEFSDLSPVPAFRAAKGPDFISRLRGFLDVQGPNAKPRLQRRAVIIRSELDNEAKRNNHAGFEADSKLIESLLHVGRSRPGARSISAVIELSDLNPEKKQFSWDDLPQDHLLDLHVDRGPLDPRLIGGSIAMSGNVSMIVGRSRNPAIKTGEEDIQTELEWSWIYVAEALWNEGATLSYTGTLSFTGDWKNGFDGNPMELLWSALKKRRVEPRHAHLRRHSPSPWLEGFLPMDPSEAVSRKVDDIISSDDSTRHGVLIVATSYMSPEESSEHNGWQIRAIEQFRRHLAVAETSVARFAISGATTDHGGRMPGIAEELMLTLARHNPVYIAGGFGGAAADVGTLLGLAHPRTGEVPESFHALSPKENSHLEAIASKLRPPPWPNLPVTPAEAVSFFRDHSFGSKGWPDNGLTAHENRLLFKSTDRKKILELVVKGLQRCFKPK